MAYLHRAGLAGREEVLNAPVLTLPAVPAGEWDVWLIEGDRSTGKTTCGARWLMTEALAAPEGSMWAVCAPTWFTARYVLEAALAQGTAEDVEHYSTARLEATLRTKTRIKGFSAERADSIRGYNLSGALFDEAGAARYWSFWGDGLRAALRAGSRLVVTADINGARGKLLRDLEKEALKGDGRVRLTVL